MQASVRMWSSHWSVDPIGDAVRYRYGSKACQDGVSGPHCVLSLFCRARLAQLSCVLSHPPRPYHMRMRGVKWGRMGYCMGVRCGMLTIRYKRNTCPRNTTRFRYRCPCR